MSKIRYVLLSKSAFEHETEEKNQCLFDGFESSHLTLSKSGSPGRILSSVIDYLITGMLSIRVNLSNGFVITTRFIYDDKSWRNVLFADFLYEF